MEFNFCPECNAWDRNENFHFPGCPLGPEPAPEPTRRVKLPKTDTYGNTFPPEKTKSGRSDRR